MNYKLRRLIIQNFVVKLYLTERLGLTHFRVKKTYFKP